MSWPRARGDPSPPGVAAGSVEAGKVRCSILLESGVPGVWAPCARDDPWGGDGPDPCSSSSGFSPPMVVSLGEHGVDVDHRGLIARTARIALASHLGH